MTDSELYTECKKWGTQSLQARWKFIGLLPEVMRREMKARAKGKSWLDRRGFKGINMFAAKLAGVSESQVELVLSLDNRFKELLLLRALLVKGEVSINKLARIVSIATKENQKELIEKVKKLSNRALEQYVKDLKNEHQNVLKIKKSEEKVLHVQGQITITNEPVKQPQIAVFQKEVHREPLAKITTLQLDADLEQQLSELQQKGININQLLRKFLKEREQKIEQEIEKISKEHAPKSDNYQNTNKKDTLGIQPAKSRYINVKIKKILSQKYGTKCAAPECDKPSEQLHHQKPFALHHTHDPLHLRPLCKAHHELAHQNDQQVQKIRQQLFS